MTRATAALRRVGRACAVAAFFCALSIARGAPAAGPVLVDRAAVRFFSPETGGADSPRFVTERVLAFGTRLEALAEDVDVAPGTYDERRARLALEHAIAEELLAALAEKLIRGSPMSRRPSDEDLARVEAETTAAFYERLGGRDRVERAAAAELVGPSELAVLAHRRMLAAFYVDRAITPILTTTDEQLREVFRTAAHPYKGHPFAEVRTELRRWFLFERLRAAENAFLQGARARLSVVVLDDAAGAPR